jgi:menaquinone-dependent protoporphyrinogen oxidase
MTILVTYASRSGSTAGIAEEIGHVLTQQGILVDVRPMQEVNDITAYQAVVAGSAIRQEQWLPEAIHFIETHQRELAEKPVATFLVCMALAPEKQQRHAKALQSPVVIMRLPGQPPGMSPAAC